MKKSLLAITADRFCLDMRQLFQFMNCHYYALSFLTILLNLNFVFGKD